MANIGSREKNSIKLIIQAYASILEAIPEFFDLYKEYHINSYKLTEVTIKRDLSFERDLMHDDRMVVINADTQTLSEFSVMLREKGIQAEFVGVGAFGPEFKAYSENVLVARYVDYEAIQAVKTEYLEEIDKLIEEEQKALEEAQELERDIEESLKAEQEEDEEKEEPSEDEAEEEEDDSPFDDDDDDDKKKKKKNHREDEEEYKPSEPEQSYYENPVNNNSGGSTAPSGQSASFETAQATNLRDVTEETQRQKEAEAESGNGQGDNRNQSNRGNTSDGTYASGSNQSDNRSEQNNRGAGSDGSDASGGSQGVNQSDKRSEQSNRGTDSEPVNGSTQGSNQGDNRNARSNRGAESERTDTSVKSDKQDNRYTPGVTPGTPDTPKDGHKPQEQKTEGSGWKADKETNTKDINEGRGSTRRTYGATPGEDSQPKQGGGVNFTTISTDMVDKINKTINEGKEKAKEFSETFKDRFGGRSRTEDPFRKQQEQAEKGSPNYGGRETYSAKLNELREIKKQIDEHTEKLEGLNADKKRVENAKIHNFDNTGNTANGKNIFDHKINVEDVLSGNQKATANGVINKFANTKKDIEINSFTGAVIETRTIDFTKEIMTQRTINTFRSLSDMQAVHKIGKIAGKMAMNAVMSGSDGQQVMRDCYMFASPMMRFTMGSFLAHGAMVNAAHTNISSGVFKSIFDEYMDVIGSNSSLEKLQNQLLFDKLLHKSFADYTDAELMQYFHIGKDKVADLRKLQNDILKGVNINDADMLRKFGIDQKTLDKWKSLMKGVNAGGTDTLMKSLMGARNGGYLNMFKRFSDQNLANIIGSLNVSDEAKKILFGMKKSNIFNQMFLDEIMKKLKRVSGSEEAQQLISLLKAANQERLFRMPKFSQLLGNYFMLVSMKMGQSLQDTDFGHGLRAFTDSARGLGMAYRSLMNLLNTYGKGMAKITVHAAAKATEAAAVMEKYRLSNLAKESAKAVGRKFGINDALAKFGSKASAKIAGYLAKTSVGTAAKALVGKITSTAAYQAVAAAASSASAAAASAIGTAVAAFWYVVLIVLIIVGVTSLISMMTNVDDDGSGSGSGSGSESDTETTKNGTLANGILADKTDVVATVVASLEKKNEDFTETINQAINNRQQYSYQVGSYANENVNFYEAERIVFRDAYGNELEPNHVDLNNTEAILSMASRYIPYNFKSTDNLTGDALMAEQQIEQYFIDYCEFLWAATHQITIEEYRPGNSATQVTGTNDAEDTSGMVTDAVTGVCSENGKTMWLQEDYTPNIVTEYDEDGGEVTQQCSSCDVPITNGTGGHNSGLCSHPRDDDLDVTPRIDGWRRTEEWRWAINCLSGYTTEGNGDHTHKVCTGYDEDGPEYSYEFEACKLSKGSYGDNDTYPKDSNDVGGTFHIHESEHIHKEYKWVYECGGHMGVVVYVTIGDINRLPSMNAAKDIDYDKVGKYVDYDPESLKVHRYRGGIGSVHAINTGTNYGIQDPWIGPAWPDLTDDEIRRITAACYNEQGLAGLAGVMYEASMLANLCDEGDWGSDPVTVIQSGWFHWTTHESYQTGEPHYGGTVTQEMIDAVSKILREGERITHADEHDTLKTGDGGILKIEVNGHTYTSEADITNRANYIPGKTKIYNEGGSVYIFMTFPSNGQGDPFGTKDLTFTYDFQTSSSTGILERSLASLEDASDTVKTAVASAGAKIGMPYSNELRDTGRAYDCSSLVYYAYLDAGIDLTYEGHTWAANECKGLVNSGKLIASGKLDESILSTLKPGDLIFYGGHDNGRYQGIYHVVMYIGNNRTYSAANEDRGCVEQDMYYKDIMYVCRPDMEAS